MSEPTSNNNGKCDRWQVTPNPEKGILGCPKMKLKLPNSLYCEKYCVRTPNTDDLSACNPLERGTYGGSKV